MRVAFISDIHGNLPALQSVLADIQRRGVDRIICLGDVSDLGPQPSETLALLLSLEIPIIQGNHDPFTEDASPMLEEITAWCRSRLSAQELSILRKLPAQMSVELPGGPSVLAVHGTPQSYTEGFHPEQPLERLRQLLFDVKEEIVVGGHTHVQMSCRVEDQWVVNAGSVGCPFARPFDGSPPRILPHCEYALVANTGATFTIELCRVPLDVARLRAAILQSGMPHREVWAEQWA